MKRNELLRWISAPVVMRIVNGSATAFLDRLPDLVTGHCRMENQTGYEQAHMEIRRACPVSEHTSDSVSAQNSNSQSRSSSEKYR
jgi:hypothetical protein